MTDKEYFNLVSITNSRRTIFEPAGTMLNNVYTAKLFEGLGYIIGKDSAVDRGQTVFKTTEAEDDFIEASKLFFGAKAKGKSDFKGRMLGDTTNMEIVTGTLIMTFKNDAPVQRIPVFATNKETPVQFFASAAALETFDLSEGDFKKKDMFFIVVDNKGFILSMTLEEFGVFLAIFDDTFKKVKDKLFAEAAQIIMKPSMQEKIYYNFGMYYKYLKEQNLLKESVYRF